jgi:selenocysteine-specific elongation factor
MESASHRIVGTAGHVDHGKSSLVLALTGVDPDRLAEEKRRGLTIVNGYAPLIDPNGETIGIIDVPGHERFIRRMLAGSGGVDVALLTVAADDGIMPQTREHLDILKLLGISHAVVALAKIDLAPDPEWLDLIKEEIRSLIEGVFINDPPIIPVSVRTGEGVNELKEAIFAAVKKCPARPSTQNFRLPLDRLFIRPGFGVVVAGTLLGGPIRVGDPVMVYPKKLSARVRGLQSHSQPLEVATPGQRVAVNLAGLKIEDFQSGDVLATPNSLVPSFSLDAQLTTLPDSPFSIKNGRLVQIYLFTKEFKAKVVLMEKDELLAGQSGYAQLRLKATIAARRGDRFVVRLANPPVTIGGGEILDPGPQKRRRLRPEVLNQYAILSKGGARQRVEMAIKERPGTFAPFSELALRVDLGPGALSEANVLAQRGLVVSLAPDIFLHATEIESLNAKLLAFLTAHHRRYPSSKGAPLEEIRSRLAPKASPAAMTGLIALWEKKGLAIKDGSWLRLRSFEPKVDEEINKFVVRLEQVYKEAMFSPPPTSAASPPKTSEETRSRKAAFDALVRNGVLVHLDDLYHVHKDAFEAAFLAFKAMAENGPVEPGPFRDRLGSSRKVAVALLETFEKRGLAVKSGSGRKPR